ncbi:MAG: von Willebrand factor type A domain-containing protein [Polyangiaceae bacterium]|nr:von Willebrand factor type A domain-containing protein [Polyangiaceae bacterium]
MKAHTPIFVVALALAIAGCGSDSGTSAAKQEPSGGNTAQTSDDDDDAAPSSDDDDDAAASSNDNDAQAPAGSGRETTGVGGTSSTANPAVDANSNTGAVTGTGAGPATTTNTGTGGSANTDAPSTPSTGGTMSAAGGSTGVATPGMGGSMAAGGRGLVAATGGSATGGAGVYPATGGTALVEGAAGAAADPAPESTASNPFVVVEHDPLSTFAADVDTASYDMFVQYMSSGMLPPASSVRLEEYVNYFEYDYPAPEADSEVPFSISLAAAPTIMDRDTVLLRVGIQGRLPPEEEKKPANLVFLVDVSGSMQTPEKLPLVQYTLLETLDVLAPSDTVSIVSYASDTRVRLEPTPVSSRVIIEQEIAALTAGGSTAGAAGLELAYQQAEAGFIEGGINHIVLCTDGDFNVGVSTTEGLLALIKEKRESGITLTALGFGSNNDSMMEAVSNAGNGIYGVIADEDHATTYVHERMLSTLVHIAKDVKLQVEFNPDEVYAYRLLGYVNRAIADTDFRNDAVDAGEIGAGHRVTALYELVLVGHDIPTATGAPTVDDGDAYGGEAEVDPDDIVLVKVRYKDVDAEASDPAYEVAENLAPSDVADSYADLDTDFQWAIAVASFAEIVGHSPYADIDNLGVIQSIVGRPVYEDDADRVEFATLADKAIPLLEPSSAAD